jgi:leader peptidase (prepilin peptidase) / N-methyltransferase
MPIFQSFARLPLLSWLFIFALLGMIVGSFLNVVIYRLPEGKSLVKPGSRCPSCGHGLAWYDNVPVLGWVWLRGRCRYCKASISIQYPLVEAATGLMFAGLFAVYYMTSLRPDFLSPGFNGSWPIFIVHLILLAGLFAATAIDAKLFIIPRSIPWMITLTALVVIPLSVYLGWVIFQRERGLFPIARPTGVTVAAGGLIGLGVSMVLLRLKVLPLSFADYEQVYRAHVKEHGESQEAGAWFHYPHPRREVLKEVGFLFLPICGMIAGWFLAPSGGIGEWPGWVFVAGGVAMGYLVGAGLVWGTRILGTLAFGKEAMGLGDVHLLAAIGAVLGAGETIPIFFVAPFFGLLAAALTFGLSAILKKRFQPIPYGPYLAGAAVVVMIFREPIMGYLKPLMKIFDILFLA